MSALQRNTSASLLAEMTDAGRFEELATDVLRASTPAYRNLVHVGVSIAGKPVPAPVDGIASAAGGALGLLLAHHTTIAQARLREKWLGEEGDIPKALRQCEAARQVTPSLPCTLILTTNGTPSVALIRDAAAATSAANTSLDVWDVKRLAQFLDQEPAGQDLRHRYFGVARNLITAELLGRFSSRNAEALEMSTLDDPACWVSTDLDGQLQERLKRSTLTFLSMPSGLGKTATAARVLRRHIKSGGYGAWASAAVFDDSYTPEQALDRLLAMAEPGVGNDDLAAQAISLTTPSSGFVLVIDDVTHCRQPDQKLRSLLNWASTRASGAATSLRVLCPVPTSVLQSVFFEANSALANYIIEGQFTADDAQRAVRRRIQQLPGQSLSALQVREIAEDLGNDPLLIGLAFADGISVRSGADVILKFLQANLKRCADSTQTEQLSDLWESLLGLGRQMLIHKDVEPLWADVRLWLKDRTLAIGHLGQLLKQRKVLVAREVPGMQERLGFRHDRVRAWLLAQAASRMLVEGTLPTDVLEDPYHAEITALAIVAAWARGLEPSIDGHKVLTLSYLVRHLSQEDQLRKQAIATLRTWWASPAATHRSNQALKHAAQWALVDVDGSDALELCSRLENNRVVGQARLRNGDALGGASFCLTFHPGLNAPFRDRVVQHAMQFHGARLLAQMQTHLEDSEGSQHLRTGLLYLAGFMRRPELALAIAHAWDAWGKDMELLHAFFWAACRCFDSALATTVGDMLAVWEHRLIEEDRKEEQSKRRDPVNDYYLSHAWRDGMSREALDILVSSATARPLDRAINTLVHTLDMPAAQEFIARMRAMAEDQAMAEGREYPFWLSRLNLRQEGRNAGRFSEATRQRLLEIWRINAEGASLRRQAFEVLLPRTAVEDLPALRAVGPDELPLFEGVLFRRIELGDDTAVPEFLKHVRSSDTGYWWQAARAWWCPAFTEELNIELDRRRGRKRDGLEGTQRPDWIVRELLCELPVADAERLLLGHWDHISDSCDFVQAALYVESSATRTAAAAALATAADPKSLLEYLNYHWQIGGTGNKGRFTLSRARALEPHLNLLSEHCIQTLWDATNVEGHFNWRRSHLDGRLQASWHRAEFLREGSIEAVLTELETAEPKRTWRSHWLEQYVETGGKLATAFAIVGRWLTKRGTMEALELAAECVADKGSRADLRILEVDGSPSGTKADAIRQDARFAVHQRTLS